MTTGVPAAVVAVSATATGAITRRGDGHADRCRSLGGSVGDGVGEAAGTVEAWGGGVGDCVVGVDRCGAVGDVGHGGDGEGVVVGVAVVGEHGDDDRGACRGGRGVGDRDGGAIGGCLAFEGAGDGDVADALGVAQPACAGAEADVGVVGAAEELVGDVAVECSHGLAVEGVAHGLGGRVPGDDDGMPGAVLEVGHRYRCGGEGAVGGQESGVVAGDVGAGHAVVAEVARAAVVGVELDGQPVLDTADAQAAAGGSHGVGAAGIVVEHDGRTVGAAVAGAEVGIEGHGEVLAHIDASRRHRRAGLPGRRGQGVDVVGRGRAPMRRQRIWVRGRSLSWLYTQSSDRISGEVRNVHIPVGSLAEGDGGTLGTIQILHIAAIVDIDDEHLAAVNVGKEDIILKFCRVPRP